MKIFLPFFIFFSSIFPINPENIETKSDLYISIHHQNSANNYFERNLNFSENFPEIFEENISNTTEFISLHLYNEKKFEKILPILENLQKYSHKKVVIRISIPDIFLEEILKNEKFYTILSNIPSKSIDITIDNPYHNSNQEKVYISEQVLEIMKNSELAETFAISFLLDDFVFAENQNDTTIFYKNNKKKIFLNISWYAHYKFEDFEAYNDFIFDK